MEVEANPTAIAWYVEEAQRLLEEQQRRVELIRARGGQIAGFGAAVLALIGGNAGTVLGAAAGSTRVALGVTFLASVICMAGAVAIAIWGAIKPRRFAALAADEIALYTSERLLTEPDLWRVQVRSLRALENVTREVQEEGNAAAGAVMASLNALLAGLGFSIIMLGTLTFELI